MQNSLHDLAILVINTIHNVINQIQIPTQTRLKALIDNTKFLLTISGTLIEKEKINSLKDELKKAEKTLIEFEKIDVSDCNDIRTYAELQAELEQKMKEKEKYIIDTCLEIVSEIINATKGQVFWQ